MISPTAETPLFDHKEFGKITSTLKTHHTGAFVVGGALLLKLEKENGRVCYIVLKVFLSRCNFGGKNFNHFGSCLHRGLTRSKCTF